MLVSTTLWNIAGLKSTTESANKSANYADATQVKLSDPFNNTTPGLKPLDGSPALTSAALFDLTELTDAFFDKVSFIGAMDATNDWTSGWAVWSK